MTKYDLYNAVGEIKEKYIKDVLQEESGSFDHTHLSEGSSDFERTIVMNVVKKKKRIRIFAVAAILFLTAAAAVIAGILKNIKEEKKQDTVIRYFTPKEIELPEKLLSVDGGYVVGDEFYVVCYYDDDKKATFTVIDTSAGDETIVNTDTEVNAPIRSAFSEKCICIAERDQKNNFINLRAFDVNTGALLNERSVGNIIITGMYINNETSIIDLFSEEYQDDGVLHILHTKINADSLETESVSDLTKYIDSSLSVNHSVILGTNGFFVVSEKVITGEIKGIYSFDNDDNYLFGRDDFDDNKLSAAAVMMKNGNISLISAENDHVYEIEETDMSSGEFAEYFRLETDEKVWSFKSINSEKYDLIYETETGYYGFIADTECSELIKEKGGSQDTLEASSDDKLLFFGLDYDPGEYVQLMDENGRLSENKYRLFCDKEIKDMPKSEPYITDDGTFYCIAFDLYDADRAAYLVSTDTEGKTEKRRIESPDKYKGIKMRAFDLAYANGSFYTIAAYESSNCVCEISPDGKILSVSDADEKVDYIEDIITTADGRIIVGYFGEGKSAVSDIMDMAYYEPGKKISENKASLPAATKIYNGFGKYNYVYANFDGLYGYTADNTIEEIADWIDSDILTYGNQNEFQYIFFDGNGSVYYNCNGLTKYEPCEKTESKTIITIASDCEDLSFKEDIKEFNKNNEDYRIKLINYKNFNSFSENGMLSSDSLSADLAAGIIPDIIITDSKGAMQFYQDTGILADMRPFIEKDTEISYDDYFENIFDAFSENGKMYQLCVNFTLSGLLGSGEILGEERYWTLDEFLDFAESHDEIFCNATSEQLKYELLSYTGFTDFRNHTCSFDSENFIRILNLIKTKGISEQEYKNRLENCSESYYLRRFVDKNCLVENIEINNITIFDVMEKAYFENGASFIGSPVENNGSAVINSGMIIGITKKSKNHDIAWEFVRSFIMDEYQEKIINSNIVTCFPVKYSAFEKIVAKAERGECSISADFYDGRFRNSGALSKDNAERLEGFIRNANKISRTDNQIKAIVFEETDLFLADGQTAWEAAENIQKKVSLYLKEIK